MIVLTYKSKCCMTCTKIKECQRIVQQVDKEGNPMIVHFFFCEDWQEVK